jgi:hypothetical protein
MLYFLFFYVVDRMVSLPAVLYGYETWCPTSREEQRLRMYKNGVLWGIFGSVRKEEALVWKRLHRGTL